MCIRDSSYLHTIRIKIVGPAPENLNSVSQNKSIFLTWNKPCLLYTSDAADERSSVDLGGRRIIKKKK